MHRSTVRLFGGPSPHEGRLELLQGDDGGEWRTVCSDGFSSEEAQVVCYMLGFG